MQAEYPNRVARTHWDPVHLNYPETGQTSETIGHRWREQPEVIKSRTEPLEEMKNYFRDYNVTKELAQSQTTLDYGFKLPETKRFNKHTSCIDNHYIYLPSRQLPVEPTWHTEIEPLDTTHDGYEKYLDPYLSTNRLYHRPYTADQLEKVSCSKDTVTFYTCANVPWTADQPPRSSAHAKTEMQRSYIAPVIYPRLVTEKDQFKHPAVLPLDPLPVEPTWHTEIEPLDTTHDGYEKYLDPYLSTNRLYHRPYTADQLEKVSCSKDTVTFYTYANVPWTRTQKPNVDEWRLPLNRPKSMYDREKFKQDIREIRTHNKLRAVPGTYRTVSSDNYVEQTCRPESQIHNNEEEIRSYYQRSIANLQTNTQQEHSIINKKYCSENTQYGSRKGLCSVFDPYVEKNRRFQELVNKEYTKNKKCE